MIGGSRHAGMNAFVISSAVEAIDREGRVSTLPSLLTARQDAKAFRAANGILVVGGNGPDSPYGGVRDPKPLKAEWLAPGGGTGWQEVDGQGPSPSAAVAQLRAQLPPVGAAAAVQYNEEGRPVRWSWQEPGGGEGGVVTAEYNTDNRVTRRTMNGTEIGAFTWAAVAWVCSMGNRISSSLRMWSSNSSAITSR